MIHVFLFAPWSSVLQAASRPSPAGGSAGLDPACRTENQAAARKTERRTNQSVNGTGVSRRPAYEKEKPRRGYAIWETKTRVSRVRQLPTDQLSCMAAAPGRRSSNIRLIIVAAAEPRPPVLFTDGRLKRKQNMVGQIQHRAIRTAEYGHWK